MMQFIKRFLADTRGVSSVEYGLMAASVAVAVLVAVTTLSSPPTAHLTISAPSAYSGE